MTTCLGNSCSSFTASAFRKPMSVYVFSYFPFGFEGRMWDLIVSVPDHCLSFHFELVAPVINNTVSTQGTETLVRDAQSKSTLRSLTLENISCGSNHPVCETTENSVRDVCKAVIKARIVPGAYLLQKNIHTFNQFKEEPKCKQQEEDIYHMMLYCPLLSEVRRESYNNLKNIVTSFFLSILRSVMSDHDDMLVWVWYISYLNKLT